MKNKLGIVLSISLSVVSLDASSASLFDVPLAKKCYAVYQKLAQITQAQTTERCKYQLDLATNYTESASLKIVKDDVASSTYLLEQAILPLRYAQLFSCINEDEIVEAEKELLDIKLQLK